MSFRLVTSVILNDLERLNSPYFALILERLNSPYFALFHRIW